MVITLSYVKKSNLTNCRNFFLWLVLDCVFFFKAVLVKSGEDNFCCKELGRQASF